MPYKALSFDLWNTLIVSNPDFKIQQASLLSDFFNISLETLSPTLAYLDKELDKQAERKGEQANFAERLHLLAEKLNCSAPTESEIEMLYSEQERLFLANLPALSEEGTGELFELLRQKSCKLFITSNTGFIAGKTLRLMLARLGVGDVWDLMLFSDEIGYSKPDLRIFEPLFRQGFLPAEVLHIGDNFLTDYQGARKNGLPSLLYTKNLRTFDANLDTIQSLWHLQRFIA